jgi:ABC-type multidrug transport system ATPase subunit
MVFGLLGPNGAGKTTLIRILATLLEPDAGQAELLGHDVVAEAAGVRELLALTGQFAAVDELLTGRENLETRGGCWSSERCANTGSAFPCRSPSLPYTGPATVEDSR